MFCHRCGNQLPDGSQFCNRCGAKMRTTDERLRGPGIAVPPPPRPARRHPIIESPPLPKPVEEMEEEFDDQVYNRRADRREGRQINRQVEEDGENYNKYGEGIIFRIHQTFIPVAIAYIVSIVASLAAAGVLAWLQGPLWLVLIFAVIFFIPAISRHITLLRTLYTLTDTKIEIQTGIFSIKSQSIPLRHILDVEVSERFGERLLGIGDIDIDTAVSESKMRLDNINDPRRYAEMILDQLHGYD
jgi:membrane protein YdbS with pleckstrin-like domain